MINFEFLLDQGYDISIKNTKDGYSITFYREGMEEPYIARGGDVEHICYKAASVLNAFSKS